MHVCMHVRRYVRMIACKFMQVSMQYAGLLACVHACWHTDIRISFILEMMDLMCTYTYLYTYV